MKKVTKVVLFTALLPAVLMGGAFFGAAVGFAQLSIFFFALGEPLLPLEGIEVPLLGGFKLTLLKVE